MSEIKMSISIKDTKCFETLLKLLEDNFKDLPKIVQDGLKVISDPLNKELTPADFQKLTKNIEGEYSDSIDEKILITKVNIALKTITYIKRFELIDKEREMILEHFWVKKGDTIIWEW